jgi:hypothetical protein
MELKTSRKMLLLSNQKKRKSKEQGGSNKHCKKMTMQEEHIIDIALYGKKYCLSIHKLQHYFVVAASVKKCRLECSHHK